MFVAGWRHALRSEWPFIIIILLIVCTQDPWWVHPSSILVSQLVCKVSSIYRVPTFVTLYYFTCCGGGYAHILLLSNPCPIWRYCGITYNSLAVERCFWFSHFYETPVALCGVQTFMLFHFVWWWWAHLLSRIAPSSPITPGPISMDILPATLLWTVWQLKLTV